MLASIIDGDALLNVVWVSVVAGLGLTLAFSVAIAAGARGGQARRAGAAGVAAAWYACTGLCALLCLGAVVVSVAVMLSK